MSNQTFRAAVFDIEGTTTSIAFVKDVLYPYASNNVEKFLKHVNSDNTHLELVEDLIDLSNEQSKLYPTEICAIDKSKDTTWVEALVKNVQTWIAQDKKLTALKKLQGVMWKEAYLNGEIKGHIYSDVPKAFERLRSSGAQLFIYSSGSVEAQKLLFQYSVFGDLTKHLHGYFDTTTGPKMEATSYQKIAGKIGFPASEILFVTDVDQEAFAATAAGMQVVLSVRKGNAALSDKACSLFRQICDFNGL